MGRETQRADPERIAATNIATPPELAITLLTGTGTSIHYAGAGLGGQDDMPLLLLVPKVALIAFIVVGTGVLIARAFRRSRANRLDPRWTGRRAQPGYEASAHGALPNTPLPEWAYWEDEGDHERRRLTAVRTLRAP
ncbi:hypothetical protein GCM10023161_14830 [Mycobacterium paraffinicum]|uniref:Uncharacterized protein n=1 Tax=Mycobacterium paraffinicum TaxID=53378 RepID=A0ABP8RFJ4_9MYCO